MRRKRYVGSVLLTFGLLTSCGGRHQQFPGSSPGFSSNTRFQRVFGDRSTATVQRRDAMFARLLSESWIGLDEGHKRRSETALRFYDPRFNPGTGQYRYQFELLLEGDAYRGVIHEFPAGDGALRGRILTDESRLQVPVCVPFLGAVCYADRSPDLEGSFLGFRVVTSDVGPVLEMKLDRPLGNSSRFDESIWTFKEQSKAP